MLDSTINFCVEMFWSSLKYDILFLLIFYNVGS